MYEKQKIFVDAEYRFYGGNSMPLVNFHSTPI